MSSLALWFEGGSNIDENSIADVHFNLWDLHGEKDTVPCLDIGIKIYNPQSYSKVYFYVPWIIEQNNICDLGKHLKTSELLCAIFNEDFKIEQMAHSKILHAESSQGEAVINIYCLDIENDVKISHAYNGTVISFSRPEQLANSNVTEYFRLRISSSYLSSMIKSYNPQNIFLQSAISTTEAIDFRFNDYRSLSPSLLEEMRSAKSYQIGKVHFLLIVEPDVDLLYSSVAPTARELEKDIWDRYYEKLGEKNVVAYHWKFKSESKEKLIENCIMFVKTKVHVCNWKTIAIYLACASVMAIAWNYISHLLF